MWRHPSSGLMWIIKGTVEPTTDACTTATSFLKIFIHRSQRPQYQKGKFSKSMDVAEKVLKMTWIFDGFSAIWEGISELWNGFWKDFWQFGREFQDFERIFGIFKWIFDGFSVFLKDFWRIFGNLGGNFRILKGFLGL